MLSVNDVSKYLGKRELFRGVSLHVHPGDRIGLIGPNGSGKSTLFQILLGAIEPDSGSLAKTRGLRIGHLPQEMVPARGKSVLARATDVHEEAQELRAELESIQQELDREKDPQVLSALATSTPGRSNGSNTWLDTTLKQGRKKSLKASGFGPASLAFRYRSLAAAG